MLEHFSDPAGLGLFDPVIAGLIAGIGLLSVLAMKIMPKRTAKPPARANKTMQVRAATATSRHQPVSGSDKATAPRDGERDGDGLARLRTIIETGTAQSAKMTTAHASASVKIDAAEHALNRMILEMNAVLHADAAAAPQLAVDVRDVVHDVVHDVVLGAATVTARDRVAA